MILAAVAWLTFIILSLMFFNGASAKGKEEKWNGR